MDPSQSELNPTQPMANLHVSAPCGGWEQVTREWEVFVSGG